MKIFQKLRRARNSSFPSVFYFKACTWSENMRKFGSKLRTIDIYWFLNFVYTTLRSKLRTIDIYWLYTSFIRLWRSGRPRVIFEVEKNCGAFACVSPKASVSGPPGQLSRPKNPKNFTHFWFTSPFTNILPQSSGEFKPEGNISRNDPESGDPEWDFIDLEKKCRSSGWVM